MLDATGHVAAQLMRSDLPKYAANNRSQGTPEENKATVQGIISYFGTYSVSGTDLLFHIDGSHSRIGLGSIRSGEIPR
jgi:Lipocalin-like domain